MQLFIFQVDIAYAPFIERFHPLLLDVKKYDITSGRPKLVSWIEVDCMSLLLLDILERSHFSAGSENIWA